MVVAENYITRTLQIAIWIKTVIIAHVYNVQVSKVFVFLPSCLFVRQMVSGH